MTAPILTLADAVVTAIDDASLSLDVSVERVYVPKFDLHSDSSIQVAVVPMADEREAGSRGSDRAEQTIHVGVMKKLANAIADEADEIDGLMDLCEEIKALVNWERLGDSSEFICTRIAHSPIYSVSEVDENRTFLSVIALTFVNWIDL